jgi:hypothetical protein
MVRRQAFVEVADPVILDANLFCRQTGPRLRPLSHGSLAWGPIAIAVSCRLNELPYRRTYHETGSEAFDATEEGVGLDKRFRPPDLVEALAGLVSTQFAQLCQPLVQGR